MADYSQFPFQDFTIEEIAQMAAESARLGDDEFVKACVEELKRRRVEEGYKNDS